MGQWLKSPAYNEYLGFLTHLSSAVKGKDNSAHRGTESANVHRIVTIVENLHQLSKLVDENPAIDQPQRFGNVAYRTWFEKMSNESTSMCEKVLPEELKAAAVELSAYWVDSFGNKSRIDYGTGHEMNFFVFLFCVEKACQLHKSGNSNSENEEAKDEDGVLGAMITIVFSAYMDLVRKLQLTYRMEPAGSHGVYSLDDYQFLPFYFGSSQLDNSQLEPKDIPELGKMSAHKNEFLFCAAIDYINQVKTGPFSEHSNMLWNMSNVPHWKKVNEGLMKMYKAEVLSKFPIMQHLLFGSLFKFS